MARLSRAIGVLLVVLCSIRGFAADDVLDSALKRLSTAEKFAFGPIGYAGVPSKGEVDFKIILSRPKATALAAFENLYAMGNPQGKSYALAGFKKLSETRFRQLLASRNSPSVEVEVMRGCIVSHEPLAEVAKQVDRKSFRF